MVFAVLFHAILLQPRSGDPMEVMLVHTAVNAWKCLLLVDHLSPRLFG